MNNDRNFCITMVYTGRWEKPAFTSSGHGKILCDKVGTPGSQDKEHGSKRLNFTTYRVWLAMDTPCKEHRTRRYK